MRRRQTFSYDRDVNIRRRAAATVAVSIALLASALLSGFLVGWFLGDHTLREWLLSYAGSAEFFGVALVATPELVPIFAAASSAIASLWRRFKAWLRRVADAVRRRLGRPRAHFISVSPAGSVATAGDLSARVSTSATTLEEKVEYLLRRDQDVQARLEGHDRALRDLPARWQADIGDTAATLRQEHAEALDRLRERHLRARLLGVGLLVIGIAVATWGNLI